MDLVPRQAHHYYRAARAPFLNLSDLAPDELARTIDALEAERRGGQHHRVFGRRYMDLRRATERRLRDRFIEAGGQPERQAPHYLVLGTSTWFAGLAPDMTSVAVDLDDLPDEVTSATYPDSFTAMGLVADYGLPYEPRPYHGEVFRLAELPALIEEHGLPPEPAGGYDGYQHRPFEAYIEIQLWSDEPVRHLLASGDGP